jgi:hypothetical protein
MVIAFSLLFLIVFVLALINESRYDWVVTTLFIVIGSTVIQKSRQRASDSKREAEPADGVSSPENCRGVRRSL